MNKKKYLDENGIKQLLRYLENQYNAIKQSLSPETIQQIAKSEIDDSLFDSDEPVYIYGGSASEVLQEGQMNENN